MTTETNTQAPTQEPVVSVQKRGRGRPKGSKNKPKVVPPAEPSPAPVSNTMAPPL